MDRRKGCSVAHPFSFFADTYETERLKTLSVWSQFEEQDLRFRPEPRARTPLEHMVHQCASEDVWMRTMLQIDAGMGVFPKEETKLGFLDHYAAASTKRLAILRERPAVWFEEEAQFFDVRRSRAWILLRRIAHSAHHRGQLTVYLRLLGRNLYSTYGPTADTGGLFQNQAKVIYRYDSLEELLSAEHEGGRSRSLPGPGAKPPTERP
jgi:uncharacterized damage-inducible protein DinB